MALLAAVAVAFLLPQRYRASALIQAVWESEADAALQRMKGEGADRRLRAVRGRVLSRSVIERVVKEVKPYGTGAGEDSPLAEQIEATLAAVSVEPRGTDAFIIQYVHDDPTRAALVANRVANLLVEESERERAARSQSSPALLEAHLGDERRALERAGEALRRRRAKRAAPPAEDLDRLARDYDEAYTAYLALQDEWRAAETAARVGGGAAARFTVVRPASIPPRPYYPNRVLFALIGLALGLTLSLGAALVAESRDRSVKGPEDLQEILPYPLLAQLPLVRTPRFGGRK
jgi:uncharacterized protein involved in exopolysaccharide biosynthesis